MPYVLILVLRKPRNYSTSQIRTSDINTAKVNSHNIICKLLSFSRALEVMEHHVRKQFVCQKCNSLDCCTTQQRTPDAINHPDLKLAGKCGMLIDDLLDPIEDDAAILTQIWNERAGEKALLDPLLRKFSFRKDHVTDARRTIGTVERWLEKERVENVFATALGEIEILLNTLEGRLLEQELLEKDWKKGMHEKTSYPWDTEMLYEEGLP